MTTLQTRVLFVDDDANLLQGMKRMLRPHRDRWDMTFVDSGRKAIEAFDDNPFDVIVSDMRMPEMDGAALLDEISRRYPSAVRIILSGFAENETVMRTVGPSHQYLAKPCDPDLLVEKINTAMELQSFLENERLRSFVAGLKVVPSSSSAYRALVAELEDPNTSANTVGDTIASDVGLAAQTLKLTNSAYFGLPTKVKNCRQAVQFLGFDTIRSLVTVANFYQAFSGDPNVASLVDDVVERSMEVGVIAQGIAKHEEQEKTFIETARCAGMLAHIGTLVLLANFPKQYKTIQRRIEEEDITILDAENDEFGATHAELGAYLLGLWGFGFHIIGPVANHHHPGTSGEFSIASAVNVAQFLAMKEGDTTADRLIGAKPDIAHLEACGKTERLGLWKDAYSSMISVS